MADREVENRRPAARGRFGSLSRVPLLAGSATAFAGGMATFGVPWWGWLAWAVAAGGMVAVLQARLRAPTRRNAVRAMSLMNRLAEQGADATSPEELAELGEFGDALRRFIEHQRTLDQSVARFLGHLDELPGRLADGNREIDESGAEIEEAVEETASLLAHINTSIRSINSEVESLSRSTEEASTSILEMVRTNEEVARIAGSLHHSAEASTTGVHEISASIRQVDAQEACGLRYFHFVIWTDTVPTPVRARFQAGAGCEALDADAGASDPILENGTTDTEC